MAHPGLVPVAKEVFDRLMPGANQIASKKREDVKVGAADLIKWEPEGPITERGLRLNINVAIQYIGAWLAGGKAFWPVTQEHADAFAKPAEAPGPEAVSTEVTS